MSRSAGQQIVFILAMILAPGCSKITVSKVSNSNGRLESDSKTTTPKSDKEETTDKDSEKVVPPNNISGTHLVCEITRDADPAATQAATVCALREDKTEIKVDLSTYRSHEWQTSVPDLNTVTSTTRELPKDSIWHLELTIKAGSVMQLDLALQGAAVSLSVGGKNNKGDVASTPIMPAGNGPRWLGLNGEPLPKNAIEGGTEHFGRDLLSICRVYMRGGVYPGKLQPHFGNTSRSVCNSTKDNETITSQSPDARTLVFANDVLIPGAMPWGEMIEWSTMLPAMAMPKNAVVGGVDDRGEALLVCRGLESGPPADINDKPNDPMGEWTPGYVKPSNGFCQHEYYGQKNSVSYQVLIWKAP